MIIDIHSHLGDILYPNGKELIYKNSVKKKLLFDVVSLSESGLHRSFGGPINDWIVEKTRTGITKASRARNFTATLENMRKSMDETGVEKTACMPIPPYVTFRDLKEAQALDAGIIPFTGVDYTREYDMEAALTNDVAQGAKGMKLHPVIQKTALNSRETFRAVEAFATHKLPVLFHCGVSEYYLGKERNTNQNPELGRINYAKDLVSAFPDVSFIAGHAGLFDYREVMDLLGGFENVWVDISFQSPENIRELISTFGPEHVMYASDWPYGKRITSIKTVKEACKGDKSLENLIFYENAAALLG